MFQETCLPLQKLSLQTKFKDTKLQQIDDRQGYLYVVLCFAGATTLGEVELPDFMHTYTCYTNLANDKETIDILN